MTEESHTRRPSRPRTLQVGLDDGHGVGAHLAGADRMMVGLAGAEGVFGQLLVARRRPARAARSASDERLAAPAAA